MGIHKTLLANILAAMGSAGPLTFGVNIYGMTGALPASGNAIVTINQVAAPNVIVPVITASRTTGVAPLAITFDAIGTTAPVLTALPFSEIHYEWRFGDDRGTFWSYGTNAGGNNKNIAFGPVGKHIFETPGTFTVELIASHINSAGQLSQTTVTLPNIVVTNPDTVFAGTATICISQNSTPIAGQDGAPAGCAVQMVPNWNTIQTLAQTYKRILLKRGDTWDVNGEASFGASQAGQGIIGAYGTGAKPIASVNINEGALRFAAGGNDWRVMDLTVTSNDLAVQTFGRGIAVMGGNNVLLLRTDINRTGRILLEGGGGSGMYVADSVIGPASSQGTDSINIYASTQDRIGLLGVRSTGSRDHGIRLQGTANSVISNIQVDGGRLSSHVCTIRGKSNDAVPATWNGLWTENVVVSDSLFDGSTGSIAALACKPVNPQAAERLRRVIVERNRIQALNSECFIAQVVDELTFRNNLCTTYSVLAIEIRYKADAGPVYRSPSPLRGFVYNNTVYKPDTSQAAGHAFIQFDPDVTGPYLLTNNICYTPGSTGVAFINPANLTTPTNYTITTCTTVPQMTANRPWAAVSPVAAVDFTPSASYAVDGGTWVPIYKNYFGTTNSNPREIGAI